MKENDALEMLEIFISRQLKINTTKTCLFASQNHTLKPIQEEHGTLSLTKRI